jgi:hypothetical protein
MNPICNCRYVVVVDEYNNTKKELDLIVQEFGRAGRDSIKSYCILYTVTGTENLNKSWSNQVCLRTQLDGLYQDSPCCSMSTESLLSCSVCSAIQNELEPRLISFDSNTNFNGNFIKIELEKLNNLALKVLLLFKCI